MLEFIREYSTPVTMQQYGHLLEDFEKNGEFVNDCIFTMMHHVAGDLNVPDALFQPLILKTFSNIWEVEFEIRDVSIIVTEWSPYYHEVSFYTTSFDLFV